MVLLLATIVVLLSNENVEAYRLNYGGRPSHFNFQNNIQRPQVSFGNYGGGNRFGNGQWGNGLGIGNNWFGNNAIAGNTGLVINNWVNNLLAGGNQMQGNHGFNRPNVIGGVRPGYNGNTHNGGVVDVSIPPPRQNNNPKNPVRPHSNPTTTAVNPNHGRPNLNPGGAQTPNQPILDGQEEAVVEIPTNSPDETEPVVIIPNENIGATQGGDVGENENSAAEEISQGNHGNSQTVSNSGSDENTAAEVDVPVNANKVNKGNSNGVSENTIPTEEHSQIPAKSGNNDEKADSGSHNVNADEVPSVNGKPDATNEGTEEPLEDLTDIFDVRLNFETAESKSGTTESASTNNSDRRSDSNICGIPGITTEPGAVDKASLLPWLVTLGKGAGSAFSFLCGGTLISPDVVISSAHCFHQEMATTAKIGEDYVPIAKIKVHDKYNISQAYYNIALIKLSSPVNSAEACLPKRDSSHKPVDKSGTSASSLEWKIQNRGELAKPSIMASKIFPSSQCVKDYENVDYISYFPKGFDSTLLCVKLRSSFICQGDSGAQLYSVEEDTETYTLVGTIANPETSCGGTDFPGIYTKVSAFLPWIEETSRAFL